MGRKRSTTLTDGELRLMRVLWPIQQATVAEIVEGLSGRRAPAYNTVLTMMRILEAKGYVKHRKEGRAFVYVPLIDEQLARRSAVRHVLDRFFDNSPGSLALSLLEHERVPEAELLRLRDLIERQV